MASTYPQRRSNVSALDHAGSQRPDEPKGSLKPQASVADRVEGLLGIGLPVEAIAETLGVTSRTVKRWRTGESRPPWSRRDGLDLLRVCAYILVKEGHVHPEYAGRWLLARTLPTGDRPLDLVKAGRQDEVLKAASAVAVMAVGGATTSELENIVDPDRLLTSATVFDSLGRPLDSTQASYRRLETTVRGITTELLKRLSAHPDLVRNLHWRDFEALIAELFRRDGFEVTATPSRGDKGVDLFAARRTGLGTLLYVVECKQYTKPIGPDFVRQLAWVIDRHRATGGVLATTSRFTAGALAEQRTVPFRMTLADFSDLRRWLMGGPIF
jgi:hypothetical protein